ncbi:acyl carrier protein [Actinoallomurus sp. CA-150999]|uniref:acyl carrier protein n=1 Tax=Actinoallomurus sp. CA-150999 TaxID=3239887 RepID=UPI003D8A1D03
MAGQADLQQWVIGVGRELGLSLQNGDDDFFDGGGDSLDAVRLIERAEEEFGADALPPDDLYSGSTVREIAATLSRSATRDTV